MAVIIGSARIDERGKASGGAAGDQKQTGTDDYKGEVSLQPFYNHKKGWYVLRPKDPAIAEKIAELMILACNNKNIGYNQNQRLGIIKNGIMTDIPTECDCGTTVRECVKEASGVDPGNFTTANEVDVLKKTGLFDPPRAYVTGTTLYPGDVLVTKTKGHTAIVVSGAIRKASGGSGAKTTEKEKSVEQIAKEVLLGKWGNGQDRKTRLQNAGYDYSAVQAEVNRILKGKK